jgi:hypothetical protein
MTVAPITERELPQLIVDQLANKTGLALAYRELEQPVGHARIDGVLELGEQATLWAEVKRDLRPNQVRPMLHQVQHLRELLPREGSDRPFVLLTRYLSQPQRDYLREGELCYADLAGNAYLKLEGNLIWIEGQGKTGLPPISQDTVFTPAAMRLAFAYLLQPQLIERPYREQAEQAGMAKSTIADHLQRFVQAGYLRQQPAPAWQNLAGLAQDWIAAYPKVLRPTLALTRLRLPHRLNLLDWAEIWPGDDQLQWGGEPAGALLTKHLRPGAFTLYSRLTKAETMIALRAIPDPEGPIEVLKTFWPLALVQGQDARQVPPLLAYADLVATRDIRNLQTAQRIHGKYLSDLFAETELGPLPNAF